MQQKKRHSIEDLIGIMRTLRDPDGGCPWDLEQTFETIAPYTIEEAYEVAEAVRDGDMPGLKDELGDLLFQVIFHARMAEESGAFNFEDVVQAISLKMIRRHPHVFGDARIADAEAQTEAWEDYKAQERAREHGGMNVGALDGVPLALPALLRAIKLQKRAARVGFDWPEVTPALDKVREEFEELNEALASGGEAKVREEFGDLMFAMTNIARHLGFDAEETLRDANVKFERRFRAVEQAAKGAGKKPEDMSLTQLDSLWEQVKAEEKR